MTKRVPPPPTGFREDSELTEFWVIRHAETTWNAIRRYQGHTDVPLSEHGKLQVQALADRLEGVRVDAIYSSDLTRSMDTARGVAAVMQGQPEIQTDDRLREIDVGELGGLYLPDIEVQHKAYLEALGQDPWNTRRPGGESMADLYERVSRSFFDLRDRHRGGRVMVVTHGGVVRVAVSLALGGELRDVWARLSIDNTSITRFVLHSGGGRLLSFNDAAHLEDLSPEDEDVQVP
ncbi:histidine phosphatase family protein [Deinococcus cellulosilyticus]|uniref:Phosphoglycerate mutase n=1 Tax=Deinococcus cellulosilyticus (strain DSM 18568 / NBRC 106333 / KACC 11606 / 5516J-15) TaxID=1223518 RepID=A0A511N5D1_DEIC1|nr:histidine phosphatase family protein [Deinococcus cellulosilyticus]GEM48062.1 phosphoglycerate mutase [Deinococcus cellulosilyticus NBRC 106333 = KACC 11606]